MRIAIRVDASVEIGTGHVRRCLSLADSLKEFGADIRFISRRHDDVGALVFGAESTNVTWLEVQVHQDEPAAVTTAGPMHEHWSRVSWSHDALQTIDSVASFRPDWLVVDHYAFDERWHNEVRDKLGCKILVIDDLADRDISADVLLDSCFAPDVAEKYIGRLTRPTRIFGGPRFALLSREYQKAPRYDFNGEVRSIGVFMGGTDPMDLSGDVLKACRQDARFRGPIEVVSTLGNPHLSTLREACSAFPLTTLSLDLPSLAGFYARHDLQIGAGGNASYERCCIGAPSVALVTAANQSSVVSAMDTLGILRGAWLPRCLAPGTSENVPLLADVVREMLDNPDARKALWQRSDMLVDAKGGYRASLLLMGERLILRRATIEDATMLHEWRNHPAIRAVSGDPKPISLGSHLEWFQQKLSSPSCSIYIGEIGSRPVGCIRFDQIKDRELEVSLYLEPSMIGLGIGRYLLLAGEHQVRSDRPDVATFSALVVEGNQKSCRLFEKCGYDGGPKRYVKSTIEKI